MNAESIWEILKIFKFTIINVILMKLSTDIYFNEIFHLAKVCGVSQCVIGYKQKKLPK